MPTFRRSYRQVLTAVTAAADHRGGFRAALHQLRHSALTHLGQAGVSRPLLTA